jgi:uncharacterized protein (DUF1330 family)
MSAYVIHIRNRTIDPSHFATYYHLTEKVKADNVDILAKGGRFEVLEGDPAEAVVILRFENMKDATEWYNSPEYQAALPHRLRAAEYRTILVDGDG